MGRVQFRHVTKAFGSKGHEILAVNDSELEIQDGEFVALVGPSGCGKSTSLRMIAGLERPTSGQIFIDDREVTNLHPRARNIAMVFQDYALYPHMTVKQNLSFGLRNLGHKRAEWEPRVQNAADILGIESLLDRQPKQLSGGQRQRVALGRAIVREPEVFLLDEPLSNLDAKLRVQMRIELAELQRRLGTTMVYVTHDQEEAMTLGHRIVVMRDGVIQQMDTPENVYTVPKNAFVARFTGSPPMNVFPGVVRLQGGELTFEGAEGGFQLSIPARWRAALQPYVGKSLLLGVRPEDIHLAEGHGANGGLEVALTASAVEMLGPQRLIYFYLGNTLAVASVDPDIHVSTTESLRTFWAGQKLHFFDGETEKRIEGQTEEVTYH